MLNSDSTVTLLKQRRFTPLYILHIFGCLYGDLYKNAIIIFLTYKAHLFSQVPAKVTIALAAGVSILPMLLFSLIFGQLAERFSKTQLIQLCTALELLVGLTVFPALYYQSIPLMLFSLFLFGTVSALFIPAKLGYLPQVFSSHELLKINGLLQTGLFISTLVGTLLGGLLVLQPNGPVWVFAIIYSMMILAVVACVFVIKVPPAHPEIVIRYSPIAGIKELVAIAKRDRLLVSSIVGVGWFWFFSIIFFMLLAPFIKNVTHGNYVVSTLMMMLLAISIAMGSLLCDRLKSHRIELALVVYGAIGMTVFSLLVVILAKFLTPQPLMSLTQWVQSPLNDLIAVAFCAMAVSAGLFLVPLSTLIHQLSDTKSCARLFSLNNISMAFFVALSSLFATLLFKLGVSIVTLFLILSIANLLYCAQLFRYESRFIKQFIRSRRYRRKLNNSN